MLGLSWCLRHLETPVIHATYVWIILIDLRIMSSDGFSWVILRMALKLNGAADQRSWGICRMTGAKSLVVLFAHMLFGQRQLHGKQGIYVQFFAAICCPKLDQIFKICFPLMIGLRFLDKCSTVFCLFDQGSAEHRWLHWCTASATDAISFMHACCTP